VLIAADSAGRREALIDQLALAGLRPQVVASWQEFLTPNHQARHPAKPDQFSLQVKAGFRLSPE
jgi:transcription-repair coupling factor (superfamily II helicase)